MSVWRSLPESPFPGLSLSELPLPAAATVQFVVVGGADRGNDDAEDGGEG